MSDNAKPFAFSQFVPGFDFLRSLTGGGSGGAVPGLPGLSNWVAPTLSVEELDKRISELKTVQYWLEQNGHALKATIQALEVQKMTLSTLKGMNVRMEDLANAFTRSTASAAAAMRDAASAASAPAAEPAAPWPSPFSSPSPSPSPSPSSRGAAAAAQAQDEDAQHADEAVADGEPTAGGPDGAGAHPGHAKSGGSAPAQGVVDTLQWWNSLTQQFQQIASNALQDAAQLRMPAASGASSSPAGPASKQGASASRKAAAPVGKPASSKSVGGKASARGAASGRSKAKAAPGTPASAKTTKAASSASPRKPATRPR